MMTMQELNITTTQGITPIDYDRSRLGIGIVHIGVGNFHRAHQAMYIDRMARLGLADDWGICGVGILPTDARMRDALGSQALEYTLVEQYPDGSRRAIRVGSIVEYLYAPDELDAVLERLADPRTRIVSLTITEGGYNISDATGRFDEASPAIQADAQPGAVPRTVFGIITAGLLRRRERGVPPFTILSCDNIENNGVVARSSFTAFASLLGPELGRWMDGAVAFPSTMVDRITPVTTEQHRALVREEYGIEDACPVVAESFDQWVIEDKFPLGHPPFDAVGANLVSDVRPYERMKLRLLNASHQALAYWGLLAGYTYAHEAAADPVIAAAVRRYMAEAVATLAPVPGVDLDNYQDQLLDRFANPYIGDTLARLATDSSDRIPKFVVPVLRDRLKLGANAPWTLAILGAWARYLELVMIGDTLLPFSDRQANTLNTAVTQWSKESGDLLDQLDWFGDLAEDKLLRTMFTNAYLAFKSQPNPRRALTEVLQNIPSERAS